MRYYELFSANNGYMANVNIVSLQLGRYQVRLFGWDVIHNNGLCYELLYANNG